MITFVFTELFPLTGLFYPENTPQVTYLSFSFCKHLIYFVHEES
jgi:hypothetical protein